MALKKRGKFRYGDTQTDIRPEIVRYSRENGYVATQFADARCQCGGVTFEMRLDDAAGAAVRRCPACKTEHAIGDSGDFLPEADLEQCACPCGLESLEITVGVALYADSEDVKWLYLGCRCPGCGLTAIYGDWKNEFSGYRELLTRV